jgi:sigma-E factor negative regulatory protein RseA
MSEQIREQVSAFLDGELPASETELLLKRLTRDMELRERFGRYALIGEAMRGATHAHLTRGFTVRVNAAIDGEPGIAAPAAGQAQRAPRWWRPLAGAAVAASVAVVAVVGLQRHASLPVTAAVTSTINRPPAPPAAAAPARTREAISYTVPAALADVPAALPAARLTSYVFAHSKYSSLLEQRDVLSGLIGGGDDSPPPAMTVPVLQQAPAADSRIAP